MLIFTLGALLRRGQFAGSMKRNPNQGKYNTAKDNSLIPKDRPIAINSEDRNQQQGWVLQRTHYPLTLNLNCANSKLKPVPNNIAYAKS